MLSPASKEEPRKLLADFLRKRVWTRKTGNIISFARTDAELDFPPGTTERLIAAAAQDDGLEIVSEAEGTVVIKQREH